VEAAVPGRDPLSSVQVVCQVSHNERVWRERGYVTDRLVGGGLTKLHYSPAPDTRQAGDYRTEPRAVVHTILNHFGSGQLICSCVSGYVIPDLVVSSIHCKLYA